MTLTRVQDYGEETINSGVDHLHQRYHQRDRLSWPAQWDTNPQKNVPREQWARYMGWQYQGFQYTHADMGITIELLYNMMSAFSKKKNLTKNTPQLNS